jgi:EAL domain-containing protein (putative c-di-GMP-specific phosphodiesterase class I)
LKIDQEFVRDLPQEASSRHVVSAVVSLARAFSLITVAEAAEDEETVQLLRQLGVDQVQGYVIARPGPVDEVLGEPAAR